VLLLAVPPASQGKPAQPRPHAAAPALAAAATSHRGATLHPALWQVSDEDTTIYLFGTIHVLEPGVTWFDGPVAAAFASADALVTEVAGIDGLEAAQAMLQQALLPPDKTLRGLLGPADRAALEAALARAQIPPAAIDRFKPWYAAVVLSSLPLIRAGYRLDQGVEIQLARRAQSAGKQHQGLETMAYQLALFDSLPQSSQIAYLRQVVDHLDQVTQQIGALVAEWGEGDADGLATAMNSDKSDPALVEALLTRRNQAWAAWIAERLAKPGIVFLAVGAGHLAGPDSLQHVLAERGIASRRVQ